MAIMLNRSGALPRGEGREVVGTAKGKVVAEEKQRMGGPDEDARHEVVLERAPLILYK
jgi:hypothetical protein